MMKKKISMRVLAIVMTVAMLFGCAVPAFAANNELVTKYSYNTKNGLMFDKISHPDTPTKQADGIVDYIGNGEFAPHVPGVSPTDIGDRGQSYSFASAAYGDWVYINTLFSGLLFSQILKGGMGSLSPEAAQAMLNVMYNGHFFSGEPDGAVSGGSLLKFNVKTGETVILMSDKLNGLAPTFRNALEMNGKLYFVGMVMDRSKGLSDEEVIKANATQKAFPCIYEIDPADNDKMTCIYDCVDADGFRKLVEDKVFTSTRAAGQFRDSLVAGCLDTDGVFLVASNDPSKGQESFTRIAEMEDLFNYPAYHTTDVNSGGGIYQVIEYNNSLYVVICTGTPATMNPETGTMRGYAIVRGDCSGDPTDKDSWTWTAVVGDEKDGAQYPFGLDEERYASGACSLEVYGDYLYVGEYNNVTIALQKIAVQKNFKLQAANLEQSVNIYRMDKDENFEMVVGDPTKQFPEGGISGMGSGFLSHMNQYIWQTFVYNNKMYVSTMDTTTFLEPIAQFTNGDFIGMSKEDFIKQINYVKDLVAAMIPKKNAPASRTIISKDVLKEINKMNKCLDKMVKLYNTNNIEAFAEQVSIFDDIFAGIEDKLPENIKKMYKTLCDLFAEGNMEDLATCLKYMRGSDCGGDLYELTNNADGSVDVKVISTDGFGDPFNYGFRIFEETDDDVVVGTANPFYGTQLWRLRQDGLPCDPTPSVPGEPASPIEIIKIVFEKIQKLIEYIK